MDVVDEKEPGILLKPFEESMQKSLLFGVSHAEANNHEAAEYIAHPPAIVVVEAGLCKAHNAARGTCFNFDKLFALIHTVGGNTDAEEALRTPSPASLSASPGRRSPLGLPSGRFLRGQLPPEAPLYAAAFAVDARLVFGDRPKGPRTVVSCRARPWRNWTPPSAAMERA